MVQTIFVVAVGWLALNALAVVLLLRAGTLRERRNGARTELTGDLRAACPISREQPKKRAPRGPRMRFRRPRDRTRSDLASVPAVAQTEEPL
jgi:hypothetical protein